MYLENKQKICDYCLRPQPQIFDTRKIGLSKTSFGSSICESCVIFRLREKQEAFMSRENTHS